MCLGPVGATPLDHKGLTNEKASTSCTCMPPPIAPPVLDGIIVNLREGDVWAADDPLVLARRACSVTNPPPRDSHAAPRPLRPPRD